MRPRHVAARGPQQPFHHPYLPCVQSNVNEHITGKECKFYFERVSFFSYFFSLDVWMHMHPTSDAGGLALKMSADTITEKLTVNDAFVTRHGVLNIYSSQI